MTIQYFGTTADGVDLYVDDIGGIWNVVGEQALPWVGPVERALADAYSRVTK